MPRPDNSTPLIDLLSANDSQNNPGFNSIILKTISGSIYQSRVGLYRTPTPFQIISRALSGWIVSAKEASAEQKYFESFFLSNPLNLQLILQLSNLFLGQFGGIYISLNKKFMRDSFSNECILDAEAP